MLSQQNTLYILIWKNITCRFEIFFFSRLEKYDIDISTFRKEIEKNHIKCFVSYNLLSHFSLTI